MHVSATRGIAELGSREDGGVVVFVAMLLPVVLLFLALSIDIGNWWVHKRHLQLQVDAAALAGGALFGGCFTDAAGTNVAIQNEATRFGGAGGSSYNGQVGGSNQGTISLLYQSATYAAGSVGSDDTETQPPCDTPSLMFDVKGSEANLPLIFQIPGLSDVGAINAHARVQLKLVEVQEGHAAGRGTRPSLHVRLRDVRQRGDGSGSRDRAARAERYERKRPALDHARRNPVSINSAHVGVRLRLVGGTDPNAALRAALHGVLRHRFFERRRPHPGLEHRRRAGCPQRVAPPRILSSGRVLRGRGLQRGHPGRGRPRRDASAHRNRRDCAGVGERRRRRHVPAHPGRHSGSRHLDRPQRTAFRGRGPSHGRAQLELEADLGHLERPDLQRQEQQSVQGAGNIRPRPARVRRRPGTLGPTEARSGLRERRHLVGKQLLPDRNDADARRQHRGHRQPQSAVGGERSGGRAARHRQPEPVDRLRSGDPEPRVRDRTGLRPRLQDQPRPRLPGLQRALVAPRAVGMRQDPDGWSGRTGRARAQGQDSRRLQFVHRADQLAELQRRGPPHRAADHHAVRDFRRQR